MFDIPIPCFGKTGTANRFTNSSFVGLVPSPGDEGGRLDIREGYVIAGYVGYDDNRPMRGRHISIYGSSGALPLWIDTANAIVNTRDYMENIQPADLAFEPVATVLLPDNEKLQSVSVLPVSGLPVRGSDVESDSSLWPGILSDVEDRGATWDLRRHFEPFK